MKIKPYSYPQHKPILSAKVCASNAELFPDILNLHVPRPATVLDMTYGNGVFWKDVGRVFHVTPANSLEPVTMTEEDYWIYANDIDPARGDWHYDFTDLPWTWEAKFGAVVLDPPYLHVGGFKTLKASIDRGYNNKDRADRGIYGYKSVIDLFKAGIAEAYWTLRKGGILIVKCQDQIESGKQCWQHIAVIESAENLGFISEDMFVFVQKNVPCMRHKYQYHARRNHSFFLVFRST